MTVHESTPDAAGAARDGSVIQEQMVIGGKHVGAAEGGTFEVINPADGKVIATAPLGGRADVDKAVDSAQKAFEDKNG